MDTAPAFTSETDALQMLDSALAYLTAADPTQLPTVIQARCLTALEQADARTICGWTDRLPEDCRDRADEILLGAALMGMELPDLAGLAAEIYTRSRPDVPDEDGLRFEDRAVKLATTFGGAGVLAADLTPECAAVVAAVLDALSAPR